MPQKPPTKKQLFQSVWLRAHKLGEVTINASSDREAKRLRFDLYNAVSAVKRGQEVNPELLEAAQSCVVQVDGTSVRVSTLASTRQFAAVFDALGGELEVAASYIPPEDAEAAASLERLKEKLLEGGNAGARVTPYFERD